MSNQMRPGNPFGLPPSLEFLCRMQGTLGEVAAIGESAHGRRGIAPVADGWFAGPRLRGRVLPTAGADWFLLRPDGIGEIDVRATMETDDGALIYVTYRGLITGNLTAIRSGDLSREGFHYAITPYFETGHPNYHWLQETVTVGIGYFTETGVGYDLYAVREQFTIESGNNT